VRQALDAGRPVVALESSLVAHGLPQPHNLEAALAAEDAVRETDAVPATTAIDDGALLVGAPRSMLERLADRGRPVAKAGSRDLGPLLARGATASTTVSATLRLAHMAGIRVMATGGIGGVHRDAATSHDVSSDIDELAATPVAVVCSGPKSILDVPATFELLETRRVPIVGIGTDMLPGFYAASAGLPLGHHVATPAEAAAAVAAHQALPRAGGILLVQPPPADVALPADEVERWIAEGLASAAQRQVRGAAVTPFVLAHVAEASGGRALQANIGLILANARTAGLVAVALAERASG
jgi:pseudouridylate synthase